jgi:hypothetical protein
MRAFLLILVIIVGVLVFGCGQTNEFLEDLNEAPQINFGGNLAEPILRDSIKLSSFTSSGKYHIALRITDINNNIADVRYEQLVGTGKLMQEDVEIISNNVSFRRDSALLEFDYYPENLGAHQFSITVTDNFGLYATAILELTAFENLLPHAHFTAKKLGQRSRYEWEFDANESYDRDERYGGEITEYEFSVLGKVYTLLTPDIVIIFPGTGIYTVGVRVKDNDNKWSNKVEISSLQVD